QSYCHIPDLSCESSTWGKGAYKTFNGKIFSFESSCTYTFCRHCVESGSDFNIEIKRSNQSEIEKITVLIDGTDVSISGKTILGWMLWIFSELSRLCASDGPGDYESWRNDPDIVCEKHVCPETQIYKECIPSNPSTCSNVAPFQNSECVSGCTCPKGYMLDDIGEKLTCVLKANCPCESNGKVYKPGEVREGPCSSKCTCQEAKWFCTEALCPGRCKVEGSSFTTFDGVSYEHPGNCHFLAVHDENWSISIELRPCPSDQTGTCLKSVTLLLNSSLSADKYLFNNDGSVTNNKIKRQGYYYSDTIKIFRVSSSYLQVETSFGLKMQIQIHPVMQLYISMPPNKFTNTLGLCGSYNNKAEDDFLSSQNMLEKTPQIFADSWEMMSCPKGRPSSCISIENEKFAEKNCLILTDPSGPFASCHSIVDPRSYQEKCKTFTCSCENVQDCLCTAMGNYVKACAENGVYISGWRKGQCEQICQNGLVFKYDVKACNSSCQSLSERDRSCDVQDVPVDGCGCPDGMYLNSEGSCVLKTHCDCYINDEIVKPGRIASIDGNNLNEILSNQHYFFFTLENCTGGAEYVNCSEPNAQRRQDRTCSSRNIPNFNEDIPCRRGCFCPIGMVRDSKGNCIFPDDCPCFFGGWEYDQGSTTTVGCNECTCIKGSWNCTQNKCQTSCHIYGDGHVRTFDGKSYSYDGLCQYSFVEDYCGQEYGTFRVLTESVPCCEDGLTCSRKIVVALKDQNVVLHDGKVTVVKNLESKGCELNTTVYSIHTVGLYLILKFVNGLILIWDKNTRVSAILDPSWSGKVCGLCGNNNGDLKDDFTTRHASVAVGALEFGNSWKTSQECSDTVVQAFPCDSNPYCKAWALRKCGIIRDSTFKDCHSKVNPDAYYTACLEEACACDMEGKYLGFCTAVAMYAEACSAVGVCVSWRKPDLCPVYCDFYNAPGECSWHYEPCGTVKAKTCKDHLIGQKFATLLEGCYAKCPDSAPYLDENTMKCVKLSDCSCFYNDVIPAGGMIEDECGRTWYSYILDTMYVCKSKQFSYCTGRIGFRNLHSFPSVFFFFWCSCFCPSLINCSCVSLEYLYHLIWI
uniref:VWFD domain-containing protein n=1 Tax=Sarcophilus harrisii TaxID=9305 RepID=G3WX81_SARHA